MKKYYNLTNNITLYQFKNFLNLKKNHIRLVFKEWAAKNSKACADAHLINQELFARLVVEAT